MHDRITVAQFKQYRDPALFIAITEADCYVFIKEFQLVEIRNIVEHADRTIEFVARRVDCEQPLYVNPLHSTKVGVHVICRKDETLIRVKRSDITQICCDLSSSSRSVALTILHAEEQEEL